MGRVRDGPAKNDEKILPLITVEKSVACVSVGEKELTAFQKMVSKYAKSKMYNIGHKEASNNYQQIANNIRGVDTVILALHNLSKSANSNWSISDEEVKFIEQLDKNHHLILVIFGSPYSLKLFPDLSNIVLAYQDERLVQEITAQSLFGVNPMEGRLPVSASSVYPYGTGVSTQALGKIGFDIPENEGLSSIGLNRIDSLVYDAIQKKATPGGQVVVAKNGKIVFSKAYGHHTYSKNKPVQTTDIYDIASITKVAATALSFMKLQQLQQIDVTHKASQYLNFLCGTNKENIVIADMLAHRAQLPGWIPFYKDYVRVNKKGKYIGLAPQAFQRSFSSDYPIEVGDNLFMKTCYIDTIFQKIVNIENRNREGYRYSDLGFILGAEIIKSVTGTTIDKFAAENFYKPLGLQTMGYKPLNRHSLSQIPPTEIDNYFRNQIIQGHVHDMAAAMLGGVSGHAGLFSNAEDLAVLMQLLINDGYYNGQQILDKATVDMFLTRYNDSRRSIGFDMKELDPTAPGRVENMSPLASPNTFGHIGFTGTCVWADRENNLVYVFLSNRTYPNMSNNLLHDNDYRPKIHSIIYESFLTKTETPLMVHIPEGSH